MYRRAFLASAIGLLGFFGGLAPAGADLDLALPPSNDIVPIPFDQWEVVPIYEDAHMAPGWDGRVMVSRSAQRGYRRFEIKHTSDLDGLEAQAMTRDMMTGRIEERRRWFQSLDNIKVA